jgi:hypothetical protein
MRLTRGGSYAKLTLSKTGAKRVFPAHIPWDTGVTIPEW